MTGSNSDDEHRASLAKVPENAGTAPRPPVWKQESAPRRSRFERIFGFFRSDLERLEGREEVEWQNEPVDLRRIRWTLDRRHAEALQRARYSGRAGAFLTTLGVGLGMAAAWMVYCGWDRLLTSFAPKGGTIGPVPPNVWELALINGIAAGVIVGAAAGLFTVARQYHERALEHQREMVSIRTIETALRLCLSQTASTDEAIRRSMVELGAALMKVPAPPSPPLSPDVTVLPAQLHELADVVEKALGALKP